MECDYFLALLPPTSVLVCSMPKALDHFRGGAWNKGKECVEGTSKGKSKQMFN